MNGWLTALTMTPLVGAAIIAGFDPGRKALARGVGLLFNAVALAMALRLWWKFDPKSGELQFVERHDWIPSLNVQYFVGVDGLGLLMVLLAALIVPFALLASSSRHDGEPLPSQTEIGNPQSAIRNPQSAIGPSFVSLLLFLQAGLFGAFTALNFVHWFVFWELSLVPAYFLIKLWGGPNRTAAATQFFIYTMVGSVTMLLGFMAIFLSTGSFDFFELAEKARGVDGGLMPYFTAKLGWYQLSPQSLAKVIFGGVFLGFAVKVPLFPFHTWLPLTYAEAPSVVTMVLTGVMSKM